MLRYDMMRDDTNTRSNTRNYWKEIILNENKTEKLNIFPNSSYLFLMDGYAIRIVMDKAKSETGKRN